jgi:hypothetical protein
VAECKQGRKREGMTESLRGEQTGEGVRRRRRTERGALRVVAYREWVHNKLCLALSISHCGCGRFFRVCHGGIAVDQEREKMSTKRKKALYLSERPIRKSKAWIVLCSVGPAVVVQIGAVCCLLALLRPVPVACERGRAPESPLRKREKLEKEKA